MHGKCDALVATGRQRGPHRCGLPSAWATDTGELCDLHKYRARRPGSRKLEPIGAAVEGRTRGR